MIGSRRQEEARRLLLSQVERLLTNATSYEMSKAEHALNRLSEVASSHEQLAAIDKVQDIYARTDQEESGQSSLRIWLGRRAGALQSVGRPREAVTLWKQLAEEAKWDLSAQLHYARRLSAGGELAAAVQWLEAATKLEQHGDDARRSLWSQLAELQRSDGRFDKWLEVTQAMVRQWPQRSEFYDQLLDAQLHNELLDQAEQAVRQWVERALEPAELTEAEIAQLEAAVNYLIGNGLRGRRTRHDPKWSPLLLRLVEKFFDHEHERIARRILDSQHFRASDQADQFLATLTRKLPELVDKGSPELVRRAVDYTVGRTELGQREWERVADRLLQRWRNADREKVLVWDGAARNLLANHAPERKLAFLRERLRREQDEEQPIRVQTFARDLLTELMRATGNDEPGPEKVESEALALLPWIISSSPLAGELQEQLGGLQELVDSALRNRTLAAAEELAKRAEFKEMTRKEVAELKSAADKAAKAGVAQSLEAFGRRLDGGLLRQWVEVERMWLLLQLDPVSAEVHDWCREQMGAEPTRDMVLERSVRYYADASPEKQAWLLASLQHHFLQRVVTMAEFQAVQRSARADWAGQLTRYLEAGAKLPGDAGRDWKLQLTQQLVAQDHVESLTALLRNWIATDEQPASWLRWLGMLEAEQGRFDVAIELWERLADHMPLGPSEYAMLAEWRLVKGDREGYEQAKQRRFETMSDSQLSNWIDNAIRPWRREGQLPSTLDEDVLIALDAALRGSNPDTGLRYVRELYGASRDFRLLRAAPRALTGRTPQQIYSLLTSVDNGLLAEVRNEATADELLQELRRLREAAGSDVDRRALDLLETLVERRAATQLNQPGPHIDAAVSALRRAGERDWAAGERVQMAQWLRSLGSLEPELLRQERQRQFESLGAEADPQAERDWVAAHWAYTEYWYDKTRQPAVVRLEAVLNAWRQRLAEAMPETASDWDSWTTRWDQPIQDLVHMLTTMGDHRRAESLLIELRPYAAGDQHLDWLDDRLAEVYLDALAKQGTVSLGSGATLFREYEAWMLELLSNSSDNQIGRRLRVLMSVYDKAVSQGIREASPRLHRFADDDLPPLLQRRSGNVYAEMVRRVAGTLEEVSGDVAALRFLVKRLESYPQRLELTQDSGWREHASLLGRLMSEIRLQGANAVNVAADDDEELKLLPRVAKLAATELRWNLLTRQESRRVLYDVRGSNFWSGQELMFARVAEEVLAEAPESRSNLYYVAEYLYHGLRRHQRAIDVLTKAWRDGKLERRQQLRLVTYLHEQNQYASSIPVLEPLVEQAPEDLPTRTQLMTAYFRTQRSTDLLRLMSETEKRLRDEDWSVNSVRTLGDACLNCQQHETAARLFRELLAMEKRLQGAGQTLADDHLRLAQAYIGLGDTKLAVENASAAYVLESRREAWRRQRVRETIATAFRTSADLKAYLENYEAEVAKTNQDSPLLRSVLGSTFLSERQNPSEAIRHFRIALELQPHDVDLRRSLVQAYKAAGDQGGAMRETLQLIATDRHNLEHYESLAEMAKQAPTTDELRALGLDAERAVTSVVEAGPNEAEHHASLAELRESQGRFEEATVHWRRVSELRRLEPQGLLRLAAAQLQLKNWEEARQVLSKLRDTQWPARFESEVGEQLKKMSAQLPPGK
ncbi:MAG: hypothetical protein KDB14_00080 [Planctomycetales bacterium]|nr:hypothetical protein [Planctomycetales bacterium]